MSEDGFPVLYRWSGAMQQVPAVRHLDLAGMVSALRQAGFEIGSTNYVNSMTVSNGAVVGISVTEGEVYKTNAPPVDIYVSLGLSGDGSESSPYPVSCESDLQAVNNNLTSHYVLVRNVLTMTNQYETAVIAAQGTSFTGAFNGNEKMIAGFRIDTANNDYLGLFGSIGAEGIVKNLILSDTEIMNGDVFSSIDSSYVGAVCGEVREGGLIVNCRASGIINAGGVVGGMVGSNNGSLGIVSLLGWLSERVLVVAWLHVITVMAE